uniref:Glutaredoxin domain-containing protein n=1 Tax=Caenorhabditis tropicalis TaxID=1561998 RepID=A0A1I7TMM0_9PELO
MGGVKSKVNVDVVQEQVKKDPVVMYTKTSCTFCNKAKDLFADVRVAYKEVNLDTLKASQPNDYLGIVNGLVYTTRQTSVPQIFICGRFVGGFTELDALRNSGHLFEAIAQCTGENAPHE